MAEYDQCFSDGVEGWDLPSRGLGISPPWGEFSSKNEDYGARPSGYHQGSPVHHHHTHYLKSKIIWLTEIEPSQFNIGLSEKCLSRSWSLDGCMYIPWSSWIECKHTQTHIIYIYIKVYTLKHVYECLLISYINNNGLTICTNIAIYI